MGFGYDDTHVHDIDLDESAIVIWHETDYNRDYYLCYQFSRLVEVYELRFYSGTYWEPPSDDLELLGVVEISELICAIEARSEKGEILFAKEL